MTMLSRDYVSLHLPQPLRPPHAQPAQFALLKKGAAYPGVRRGTVARLRV
jgi:hypothetical protein